jgi:hypothetical protein
LELNDGLSVAFSLFDAFVFQSRAIGKAGEQWEDEEVEQPHGVVDWLS